jgi:ribosomal protein S18 acetylase RimI-like enzyme
MTSIIIRMAQQNDIKPVTDLILELANSIGFLDHTNRDIITKNFQTMLSDPNTQILVAESDNKLVGVLSLNIRNSFLHSSKSALIDEMIVTEEFRGKGVGKRLINAAIDQSTQLGCCELEVSTQHDNTDAIEFYHRLGFDDRGVLLEIDLD